MDFTVTLFSELNMKKKIEKQNELADDIQRLISIRCFSLEKYTCIRVCMR